jgi:hypothetical protein
VEMITTEVLWLGECIRHGPRLCQTSGLDLGRFVFYIEEKILGLFEL